ncbi:MAG: hypothetical protein A2049_05060 [Elusimicrobia bacterium GWA2_62_23]|nr:MAG: hypothetical protein A2049_05060 [Elusimicrobia bacterium GWA2_62_23]
MKKDMEKIRAAIASKVRDLRLGRRWSQVRLAALLGISQNRLSEIERGDGSFTAEQLVLVISTFNLQLDYFSVSRQKAGAELQNTLARLGAGHLREDSSLGAFESSKRVDEVILEALIAADSPRQVAAVAPVLVAQIERVNLGRLRLKAAEAGYEARLGWALENVLGAIRAELPRVGQAWRLKCRRAELLIGAALAAWPAPKPGAEDILDREILSEEGAAEARAARSAVARKWGIVTRITAEDFNEALRDGRGDN